MVHDTIQRSDLEYFHSKMSNLQSQLDTDMWELRYPLAFVVILSESSVAIFSILVVISREVFFSDWLVQLIIASLVLQWTVSFHAIRVAAEVTYQMQKNLRLLGQQLSKAYRGGFHDAAENLLIEWNNRPIGVQLYFPSLFTFPIGISMTTFHTMFSSFMVCIIALFAQMIRSIQTR